MSSRRGCKVHWFACVPLLLTAISFAVVSISPPSLWTNRNLWGKQKETAFCEPVNTNSANREPVNSWSNLGYSLAGTWSLGAGLVDTQAASQRAERPASSLPPYALSTAPEFSIWFGATWLGLGVCSFMFHAANTRVWQMWDVGMMTSSVVCMIGWSACSLCVHHVPIASRHVNRTRAGWLLSSMAAQAVCVALKWRYKSSTVMSALIGVLVLLECAVQPALATRSWTERHLTHGALTSLMASFTVRELEANKGWGKPLCLGGEPHWFQPHAVWHLGTALALALQYRSWRLCALLELPLKRSWHRCPHSCPRIASPLEQAKAQRADVTHLTAGESNASTVAPTV